MLRRRRSVVSLDPVAPEHRPGYAHVAPSAVTVLRWLNANRVDYVLVGPVAHAIRGELTATGAVGIVPAPYLRNYERLSAALIDAGATLRGPASRGAPRPGEASPARLTADTLARGRRWLLRCDGHELDVESSSSRAAGAHGPHEPAAAAGDGARYQELVYEAARHEVAAGVLVEVAAPEDLELYSHLRRTGRAPEFRVTRASDEAAEPPVPQTPRRPADS